MTNKSLKSLPSKVVISTGTNLYLANDTANKLRGRNPDVLVLYCESANNLREIIADYENTNVKALVYYYMTERSQNRFNNLRSEVYSKVAISNFSNTQQLDVEVFPNTMGCLSCQWNRVLLTDIVEFISIVVSALEKT